MERFEIQTLLILAERIQDKILTESDPKAKGCLINDLKKVKAEIGKRVLDLPVEIPIFDDDLMSTEQITQFTSAMIDENEETQDHISESEELNPDNLSELPSDEPTDTSSAEPHFEFESGSDVPISDSANSTQDADDIARKFQNFLKTKKKPKSRIPVKM